MTDKQPISSKKIVDYDTGDIITAYFSVRKKQIRESYKGQFVSLELGDSTGRVPAVLWEADQFALTELSEGMVLKAKGQVGEYRDKPQFIISQYREAEADEYQLEDILPHSTFSRDELKARLMSLTEKVENSYIKQLIESFWADETFLDNFLNAPAGKLWHHAYIGGLAEHSANLAELALRVSNGYPFLNRDYLIFGGLFHDAGKIETYSTEKMFDYTDQGRLVGHICLVDNWICRKAEAIDDFPDSLLVKLRHIILSHQGELEYATPVVPQMPEAFVVYYCDEIDSKMGALDRIRSRQKEAGWSDYVSLISRFLYFDNVDDVKSDDQ